MMLSSLNSPISRIDPDTSPPATPDYRAVLQRWSPHEGRQPGGGASGRLPSRSVLHPLIWVLIDALLWALAFFFCYQLVSLIRGTPSALPNATVFLIPCAISLVAAALVGAYDQDTEFSSLRFSAESLIAGMVATVVGAGAALFFGSYGLQGQPSRMLLLATPMVFAGLSLFARRSFRRHPQTARLRVLLIGAPAEQARLQSGLNLVKPNVPLIRLDPAAITAPALSSVLQDNTPDTPAASVIVLGPDTTGPRLAGIAPLLASLHASGLPVYSWQSFWSQRLRMLDVSDDPTHWLFDHTFLHQQSSAFWHGKRLIDILLSLAGLTLAAPLLIVLSLAIKLDSPGPVFFRQDRTGLRGREFRIWKFRTMRQHAERDGSTTTRDDPRITRLGHFLRRSRLDEVPQLLNVLRGDMSVVGPRPEWTLCVANYEDKLPGYHLRHLAKPGITGWAQVNYPYGTGVEDAAHKLAFDLHYITHASLVLDFSILLKSIYIVLGRVGSQ